MLVLVLLAAAVFWMLQTETPGTKSEGDTPDEGERQAVLEGQLEGAADTARSSAGASTPAQDAPLFELRVLAEDGAPIVGASVKTAPNPAIPHFDLPEIKIVDYGETDRDGRLRWSATGSKVRHLRLRVRKAGYLPHRVNLVADEEAEVRLTAGHLVRGIVLRVADDTPVGGAVVRAFQGGRQRGEIGVGTVSAADGTFQLDAVPLDQPVIIAARLQGLHADASHRTFPGEEQLVLRVGGPGKITGTVLQADGRPAIGMTVWLMHPQRAIPPRSHGGGWLVFDQIAEFYYSKTTTDDRGRYEFLGVPLDTPRMPIAWIHKNAEVPHEPVTLNAESPAAVCDIQLPALGTIRYRVLNEHGEGFDEPPNMQFKSERVWFRNEDRDHDAADEDALPNGAWREIENLVPGTWRVRAWIPNRDLIEQTIELRPGATAEVEFRAAPAGATITGTVVDEAGKPLAGIEVEWHGERTVRSGVSDAEGRFAIQDVNESTGRIEAAPGMELHMRMEFDPSSGRASGTTFLENVLTSGPPLRIVMRPASQITGRFLDLPEGASPMVSFYSRYMTGGGGTMDVEEEGRFTYPVGRPGTPALLRVDVSDDRGPWFIHLPALEVGKDFDLGDIKRTKRVDLSGVVLDPKGEPVHRAEVLLAHRWLEDAKMMTRQDGSFRFEGISPGSIWVRVDAPNEPVNWFTVECAPGPNEARLQLQPRGGLRLVIKDEADAPVPDCSLSLTWGVTSTLDNDLDDLRLSYAMPGSEPWVAGLQPGTYRIRVYDKEYERQARGRVTVESGKTTDLELTLVPRR